MGKFKYVGGVIFREWILFVKRGNQDEEIKFQESQLGRHLLL